MPKNYIFLVFLTLLVSCTQISPKSIEVVKAEHSVQYPVNETPVFLDNFSPKIDFREAYEDFNILRTYGVEKEKMMGIIYKINPIYFDKLNEIEVIYSNRDALNSNIGGWYYVDSRKITIYYYNEGDEFVKHIILHELKHHYCNIKNGNAEINHQGCFLDTPIDKEYGYIK